MILSTAREWLVLNWFKFFITLLGFSYFYIAIWFVWLIDCWFRLHIDSLETWLSGYLAWWFLMFKVNKLCARHSSIKNKTATHFTLILSTAWDSLSVIWNSQKLIIIWLFFNLLFWTFEQFQISSATFSRRSSVFYSC